MNKIILVIFIVSNFVLAGFELDRQVFDGYNQEDDFKLNISPAVGVSFDFRDRQYKPMSFFLKSYFKVSTLLHGLPGYQISNHYSPALILGGGLKYRHKLFSHWFLDSRIGLYWCYAAKDFFTSNIGFITPIYGIGIFNAKKSHSYNVEIVPYNERSDIAIPSYFMFYFSSPL